MEEKIVEKAQPKLEPFNHGDAGMDQVVQISGNYIQEAKTARFDRIQLNKRNYDVFHLRQNYEYKREGQSREMLSKQMMAVEQTTQFFQQGLADLEDWYSVEYSPGIIPEQALIKKDEIYKLSKRQLDKADFTTVLGDSVKTGLLASLMICKVVGKKVKTPFYVSEDTIVGDKLEKTIKRGQKINWQLDLRMVMPENYYPDPSGRGLYEMDEIYLDYFEVKALSEGPNAIFDAKVVEELPKNFARGYENQLDQARRTGQNTVDIDYRKKVKLQEFWGSIVDSTSGELLFQNVVWTIADDRYLVQRPTPNPFWHGESPYVVSPIIRVPDSTWHRALMDAPSANNIALNELYNLLVDGGMMSTYGIKQYRPDWIADDAAYSDGFYAGQSVPVTASCPPGMKAIERVDTSSISQESFAMFNIINAEFNASALSNDLRMGVMPSRAVKATEVVEASQSISSTFSGMSTLVEVNYVEEIVRKSWIVTLQNMDDLNQPEVKALLGVERAAILSAMSPEDRFANSVMDCRFKVFGISRNLTKAKDFKKVTAFLQTISASPLLLQEFMQKYSMERLLGMIMRALDLNTDQLTMNPEEQAAAQARMLQAMQMAQAQSSGQAPGGLAADQSQIPQAGGARAGSDHDTVEGRVADSGMSRG